MKQIVNPVSNQQYLFGRLAQKIGLTINPKSQSDRQLSIKQIIQHLKTGQMKLAEVPCPQVGKGQVLIQTKASLISAGTEKMLIEFSNANLIQKA